MSKDNGRIKDYEKGGGGARVINGALQVRILGGGGGGGGGTTYSADETTLHLTGTTFSIKDAGVNLAGAKVTGVLPIANGGTGQITAIAAFNALSPSTTKGDIIVNDGTNDIRLPVGGTNGFVLTIDSTQTSGMKWAAAGGGSTSPLTTKGDIWGFSTLDARFPVGANGLPVVADSAQALGVRYAEQIVATTAGVMVHASGTTAASDLLHVSAAGSANALRVKDSTGNTGIGQAPDGFARLAVTGGVNIAATSYFAGAIIGRGSTYNVYAASTVSTDDSLICVSNDESAIMQFGAGGSTSSAGFTRKGFLQCNASLSGGFTFEVASGDISFKANGAFTQRNSSNGVRIQVGATTSPSDLLHVAATGNGNALRVSDSTGFIGLSAAPQSGYAITQTVPSGTHYAYLSQRDANNKTNFFAVCDSISNNNGNQIIFGVDPEGLAGFGANAVIVNGANGSGTTRDLIIGNYDDKAIRYFVNATEQMRQTSSGFRIQPTAVTADPDASCVLDLVSTTKGLGLPVMTTTQQNAISAPRTGLMIYNSTTGGIGYYTGSAWKSVVGI